MGKRYHLPYFTAEECKAQGNCLHALSLQWWDNDAYPMLLTPALRLLSSYHIVLFTRGQSYWHLLHSQKPTYRERSTKTSNQIIVSKPHLQSHLHLRSHGQLHTSKLSKRNLKPMNYLSGRENKDVTWPESNLPQSIFLGCEIGSWVYGRFRFFF